jgi:hypothetical protein
MYNPEYTYYNESAGETEKEGKVMNLKTLFLSKAVVVHPRHSCCLPVAISGSAQVVTVWILPCVEGQLPRPTGGLPQLCF